MSKLAILHLSDLHFRDTNNFEPEHVRNIINAIRNTVVDASALLVIISGDLANEGKAIQYIDFDVFLDKLVNSIRTTYTNLEDVYLVTVPGNHDVDQTGGVYSKEQLEEMVRTKGLTGKLEEELVKEKNYIEFANRHNIVDEENRLIEAKLLEFDGYRIKINLINTAPFSARNSDDQGAHFISDDDILGLKASEEDDYIFTVMHHPYYWFEWNCRHKLVNTLISSTDIVFLGHDHFQDSHIIGQDGLSTMMQDAGKLCNIGNWHSSEFYVSLLDLETREYRQILCHWDESSKIYQTDKAANFKLSKNRRNEIGLSPSNEYLERVIIDHRFAIGKDIRSYFVFPYLEEENNKGQTIPVGINNLEQFLELLSNRKNVVLKGGKEAGKTITTIITHLALNRCCASIHLNCDDFRRSSINPNNPRTDKIETIITNTIIQENDCLKTSIEQFSQLPQEKKAIIIDDFDYIDPKVQDALISYLKPRFGIILLTCQRDIIYDIYERARIGQLLDGFSEFAIWSFTGKKRTELVERVASISGKDDVIVKNSIIVVNDLLLNAQLLYRWDPSFIIQLTLHLCENSGSPIKGEGDLFGDVVQATITNLISPVLAEAKFDMTCSYAHSILDLIAYNAHSKEEYPISFETIEESINEYNKDHRYHCPIAEFISAMKKAYIIGFDGSRYKFTRNSFYAFFVAREMKRRCTDRGDYSVFERTIEKAYKNINAYVILYFTYIMDSRVFADKIIDFARKYTEDWEEFSISNPQQEYFRALEIPKTTIDGNEEENREIKQKEEERFNNRQLELLWLDPYKHTEDEEDALVGRSISLLIVVSQMLPNLSHLLFGDDIDKLVDLVYRMPLKIFNYWANAIDIEKVDVIRDIQRINTLEYRDGLSKKKDMTNEEALQYLRGQSFALLLELMNQSMVNASRETTYEFLDSFSDLHNENEIAYEIERLLSFEKRRNPTLCINEFERVLKESKPGVQTYLIQQVIKHYIVFSPYIDTRNQQRLYHNISDKALPEKLLSIDRRRHDIES